jgi:hypothetical protein
LLKNRHQTLEKDPTDNREAHEDTQDKRDKVVEGLFKTTLKKDPIDNLDHLATVMGHIQRVVTPRTSHSAIAVPWNLNVNSSASGAGSGSGTGGSPRVICLEDHHPHHVSRSHSHHHHHSRSSSTSSSDSPPPHHRDPSIHNDINVIQGGGGEDYSIDEASTVSSHGRHYHRHHLTELAHQHDHRLSIERVPIIVDGVPGEWNRGHHHGRHEHHETVRL